MIADVAAWIFTLFVVDPFQAEMKSALERANLPVEVVQQSRECLATQVPRLVERAGNEPGWAVATAVGISIGWTPPERLLDATDPTCGTLRGLMVFENSPEAEG